MSQSSLDDIRIEYDMQVPGPEERRRLRSGVPNVAGGQRQRSGVAGGKRTGVSSAVASKRSKRVFASKPGMRRSPRGVSPAGHGAPHTASSSCAGGDSGGGPSPEEEEAERDMLEEEEMRANMAAAYHSQHMAAAPAPAPALVGAAADAGAVFGERGDTDGAAVLRICRRHLFH